MVLPQTTSQEVLQGPSRRPNASRRRGDQASQTSHAQLDIKPRDDARDELFDLPFGLVTVADVAHPQAADLEQPRNVIPQWFFKVSQIRGKSHSQAVR
jgi:hypothetical protein